MKPPHKTLRAVGAGRMVVKYHAHALTLFAVFWSLPSAMGFIMFYCGLQDLKSLTWRLSCALIPCAIHLVIIAAAIYYWFTERKRRVIVLKTSGDLEA